MRKGDFNSLQRKAYLKIKKGWDMIEFQKFEIALFEGDREKAVELLEAE